MKQFIFAMVVVAVLVASFTVAGAVYAQTPNPQNPYQPGYGQGQGMMGGQGRGRMMGGQQGARGNGLMNEEMVAAFASKLNMTAAELQKQLDAGQTMGQVAFAKGISAADFQKLWAEARTQAVDAAVKAGKLTQEQADWMKTRGGMMGGGMGQGRNANTACPYYTAPTN